jgi:hypothetical protein
MIGENLPAKNWLQFIIQVLGFKTAPAPQVNHMYHIWCFFGKLYNTSEIYSFFTALTLRIINLCDKLTKSLRMRLSTSYSDLSLKIRAPSKSILRTCHFRHLSSSRSLCCFTSVIKWVRPSINYNPS